MIEQAGGEVESETCEPFFLFLLWETRGDGD